MSGETNLETLLKTMEPALCAGVYVFGILTDAAQAAKKAALSPEAYATWLADLDDRAEMTFREEEGRTYILPAGEAQRLDIPHEYRCRKITLTIHSSLEAVGFLGAVLPHLAAGGISVNVVSAMKHDHLFVPEAMADKAFSILKKIPENPFLPPSRGAGGPRV